MREQNKSKTEEERKQAKREASKRYYQLNRERVLERCKQYRESHKEEIAEHKKQYYQLNREKEAERWKQYYKNNREKELEQQKQYNQTPIGRATSLIGGYRRNDKKHNRGKCTLTAQWIVDNIFTQPCHYCGESDWRKLGVDRIDNTKPHTTDNVVCCCAECNTKKGTTPYEEYLKRII